MYPCIQLVRRDREQAEARTCTGAATGRLLWGKLNGLGVSWLTSGHCAVTRLNHAMLWKVRLAVPLLVVV